MSKSQILVLVQFSCIAFFVYRGGVFVHHPMLLVIEIIGIMLGVWAIAAMRIEHLSIFPEPKATGALRENGPYRWIRHPMYTAVLLTCLALALESARLLDAVVFAVLFLNQWIKLRYEETLLLNRYDEYAAYMQRTKALIPFVI
jgi:protein-S-isoprenylcysteine O-methyltransferase Ste14